MDAPTPPQHTEPGTLCLALDTDRLPGDRLAALIEAMDQHTSESVKLVSYRLNPVRMEFAGTWAALDGLRTAVERGPLRSVFGTNRPTMQLLRGTPSMARGIGARRLVLLADFDPARSRRDAECLARADIDTCVVSRAAVAQRLMQRTALPFDAMIVHHRLSDFDGLELLRRLGPEGRHCSITIFADRLDAEQAAEYRKLGAFRYVAAPDGPLQLISRVGATISETLAWRVVEQPGRASMEEPPRVMLDPDQAADRLRFTCGLSPLEREVARMVLLGCRDLDIAKRLRKSERTAKRHVGRVLEKAGIQNRASLWAVLYRDGRSERPESRLPGHTPAAGPSAPTSSASASTNGASVPGRSDYGPSVQVGW